MQINHPTFLNFKKLIFKMSDSRILGLLGILLECPTQGSAGLKQDLWLSLCTAVSCMHICSLG